MAKVFISVLGTSKYLECIYTFENELNPCSTRYVQEATVANFCRNWSEKDRILIFTTKQAEKTNWIDQAIHNPDDVRKPWLGLKSRLYGLEIPSTIQNVEIPEGKSVDEIWIIFEQIYESLHHGDEVIFDITHAFRSIPMLVMIVLNYAAVLKKIKLKGIYYGAFEVLGNPREAEQIPLEERKVSVFDLTPFVELQQWSIAIDRFIKSGDADLAAELARAPMTPFSSSDSEELASKMTNFTMSLATCRGPMLAESAKELRESIKQFERQNIRPSLKHLLDLLEQKVEQFPDDEILSGLAAAKWCLEHNLIQQGFTILQETAVSYMCQLAGVDHKNNVYRKIAPSAIVCRNKPRSKWQWPAINYPEITDQFIASFEGNPHVISFLDKPWNKLKAQRNDLDHAAYTEQTSSPEKFLDRLRDGISQVEKLISPSIKDK